MMGGRRLGRETRDDVLTTMETVAICGGITSRGYVAALQLGLAREDERRKRRRRTRFELSLSKVPSSCLIEFYQPGGANLFTKYLRK